MNFEYNRIDDIHQWTLHLRGKVDSKKSHKYIILPDLVFTKLLLRPE